MTTWITKTARFGTAIVLAFILQFALAKVFVTLGNTVFAGKQSIAGLIGVALTPLGFGLIIYPLLVIVMYFLLTRIAPGQSS